MWVCVDVQELLPGGGDPGEEEEPEDDSEAFGDKQVGQSTCTMRLFLAVSMFSLIVGLPHVPFL
jgi:hypothetical protein